MDLDIKNERPSNFPDTFKYMLAGGLSGQVCWLFSYPFDVVKTNLQTNLNGHKTIREVCIHGFKREGVHFFYKGLTATLFYTFVTQSVVLPLYESLTTTMIREV